MNMKFLALDTSTDQMSVAVSVADRVWSFTGAGGAQSSSTLIAVIQDLLAQAQVRLSELTAIVWGQGPGSFTGLRTACSVAQGLGFGAGVPLLPVSTLWAAAEDARSMQQPTPASPWHVLALLDARMGELYAAELCWAQGRWSALGSERLMAPEQVAACWDEMHAPNAGAGVLSAAPAHLVGNAFMTYSERMHLPASASSQCITAAPTATALLRLAPFLWAEGAAVPAEQALPRYVRDKVAQTTAERMLQRTPQPQ
jgi:tRNA threonylcarbamoyladenosine biosynthesis protein TsaB